MTSRLTEMRDLTRRGHAGQTRNGGRLPYWVHTDGVADICQQALALTGELPADEAEDLVLAAYGHDLYEDTSVSPERVRSEFGARVDGWIGEMTNRRGDRDRAEYLRHMAAAADEVRVIKCADLIDNMLSVAYGLHDLGLEWVNEFFLPIAGETREVLLTTPFERLSRTGAHLTGLVDWAWHRLDGAIATAASIDAGDNPRTEGGDAMSDNEPKSPLPPEVEALVQSLTFTEEEWDASKASYEAKQEARAKELFGDGPRFAIPDVDTDS